MIDLQFFLFFMSMPIALGLMAGAAMVVIFLLTKLYLYLKLDKI